MEKLTIVVSDDSIQEVLDQIALLEQIAVGMIKCKLNENEEEY